MGILTTEQKCRALAIKKYDDVLYSLNKQDPKITGYQYSGKNWTATLRLEDNIVRYSYSYKRTGRVFCKDHFAV